jgi:hypothetical protein
VYENVSLSLLHSFFDWLLNQKTGKGGRRMHGTKYRSSLGTYWKLYRLVCERASGDKIKGQINRGMHKVLDNHMRRNSPFGERKSLLAIAY